MLVGLVVPAGAVGFVTVGLVAQPANRMMHNTALIRTGFRICVMKI